MKPFLAVVNRDVLLALRQGGGLGAALGFILAVIVLVPLSIGPDQMLLRRLAPGLMWLTLLLGVLLTAERIFNADLEDGSLELFTMGSTALEIIVVAKALAHWFTVSLPLAILVPFLGFMLNMDGSQFFLLLGSMVLGSLSLSLLASLGGAVTAGLRRGGLLISLLILPLYAPVLVFGVSATSSSLGPGGANPSLIVLGAITLLTIVVIPFATAAALKSFLR
jgi:heme exporter protein B